MNLQVWAQLGVGNSVIHFLEKNAIHIPTTIGQRLHWNMCRGDRIRKNATVKVLDV